MVATKQFLPQLMTFASSFAFVCHHNSLLIYGSLHTPTLDRFSAITHVSTALSLIFCLLLGLAGFLVFTDKTQGNILNNFSPVSNALKILLIRIDAKLRTIP